MDELPNRIRELREARSWSLDRLAGMVGCSKIQMSELERGLKPLTVQWMKRIAPHLDVAPGELLNLDDNPLILSDAEIALIERFRGSSGEGQAAIVGVAEAVTNYRPPRKDEAA